jgi:hypothetical protein
MKTRYIFGVALSVVSLVAGCEPDGKGTANLSKGIDAGKDVAAADSRAAGEINASFDAGGLARADAAVEAAGAVKDVAPVADSDPGMIFAMDAAKDLSLDADASVTIIVTPDTRPNDPIVLDLDAGQDSYAADGAAVIPPLVPDAARDSFVPDTVPWGPEVLLSTPDALVATPDVFVAAPDTLPALPDVGPDFAPDVFIALPDVYVGVPDTLPMAPDTAPVCTTGTLCGNSCTETATDPANCGACGHACPADNSCYGGVCSCYHVVPEAAYGNDHEIHLMCGATHFASVVITNASVGGTFSAVLRSRPGTNINGWGPGHHLAAFLAGSDAAGPVKPVAAATASADGISVTASGSVNKAGGTYGTWNTTMLLAFDQAGKSISGSGTYQVNLAGSLAAAGADLNLGRMASNYLTGVPLQCGGTGNTGDTSQVQIERVGLSTAVWDWVTYPSTCPSESSTNMTIDAVGNCNDVDTKAMGLTDPTIVSVYKPGYSLNFESLSGTPLMIFCGSYTKGVTDNRCPGIDVSRCPFDDNLGMEHIVKQGTETGTSLSFKMTSRSYAMPGDGAAKCCP